MSLFYMGWKVEVPYLFSFLMMIIIMIARVIAISSLPLFSIIFCFKFKLKIREMKVIWYSGLIRGIDY